MNNNHKYILIAVCCIIGLLVIFLVPDGSNNLTDAIVNESNGDIAITYYDYDSHRLNIRLYDREGNLLFHHNYYTEGGTASYMLFLGDDVALYLCRIRVVYLFDRNGVEKQLTEEALTVKERDVHWEGWTSSIGNKTYSCGDYVYLYETAPYFKSLFSGESRISVKNKSTGSVRVVFERK